MKKVLSIIAETIIELLFVILVLPIILWKTRKPSYEKNPWDPGSGYFD